MVAVLTPPTKMEEALSPAGAPAVAADSFATLTAPDLRDLANEFGSPDRDSSSVSMSGGGRSRPAGSAPGSGPSPHDADGTITVSPLGKGEPSWAAVFARLTLTVATAMADGAVGRMAYRGTFGYDDLFNMGDSTTYNQTKLLLALKNGEMPEAQKYMNALTNSEDPSVQAMADMVQRGDEEGFKKAFEAWAILQDLKKPKA